MNRRDYTVNLTNMSFGELHSVMKHVGGLGNIAYDKNQFLNKMRPFVQPKPPLLDWRNEDVAGVLEALERAWEMMRME